MKSNKLTPLFSLIKSNWLPFLAAITTIIVFFPLSPIMPSSGLDPSWRFGMNIAVAENLQIGKDIVFTFGPYSSIYTHYYHPSTYHLMLFGSLLIGICYGFCVFYLGKKSGILGLFIFIFVIINCIFLKDSLFFSYPLLLTTCIYVFLLNEEKKEKPKYKTLLIVTVAILMSPIGLMPLIKGSFMMLCISMTFLVASYLYYLKYHKTAILVVISPVLFSLFFWILSGQSITDFPNYFMNIALTSSGYSEAMSVVGDYGDIFGYLIVSCIILWTLLRLKGDRFAKIFLGASFLLFLFISFKAGFVRHDGHSLISAGSLILGCLILYFISQNKISLYGLLFSIIVWVYTDKKYINTSTEKCFNNVYETYVGSFGKLKSLITGKSEFKRQYEQSLELIRKENPIPSLSGSTDIYSFDQANLLASNNKWNPRPMFQSYSAYTPALAKINEQHLRKISVPDNVLFSVQPIDGRLPSLEDGLSWPALFDNYTVTKIDNNLAYLKKDQIIKNASIYRVIHDSVHKVGAEVLIPRSVHPVFAEIEIKPTLMGRLMGIAYKPPQLKLRLKQGDGSQLEYRVIANMMESGFFLSPVIKNTKDFVILATGNQQLLTPLESIQFVPPYGGSLFWSSTYHLKLKEYMGKKPAILPYGLFDTISDSIPVDLLRTHQITGQCDGSIDLINGLPAQAGMITTGSLSADGWLAVSAKDGIVPDYIILTLKKTGQPEKYVITNRIQREDVKVAFNQPKLINVGFTANIDVRTLSGEYELGLALGYQGNFQECIQFKIPIKIIGIIDRD